MDSLSDSAMNITEFEIFDIYPLIISNMTTNG